MTIQPAASRDSRSPGIYDKDNMSTATADNAAGDDARDHRVKPEVPQKWAL